MMDDSQKSSRPSRKPGTNRKKSAQPSIRFTNVSDKPSEAKKPGALSLSGALKDLKQEFTDSTWHVAAKAGGASWRIGIALLLKPEHRKIFREAALPLKDVRNLVRMTQNEISHVLKEKDTSLLKAVEGWAVEFSIELILRVTGIYSRDDLIPFLKQYSRTYSPAIWELLDGWGIKRLHLYLERERGFVSNVKRIDNG
jgi:hypothetical protein